MRQQRRDAVLDHRRHDIGIVNLLAAAGVEFPEVLKGSDPEDS